MTERIDHAAEAVRYLSTTALYGSPEYKNMSIAEAQAHAALALAEQQRIANLVSIAQAGPDGAFSTVARDLAYLSIVGPGSDANFHPDVAAALGIKVQADGE